MYLKLLSYPLNRLCGHRVFFHKTPENLRRFFVLQARNQFRQHPPPGLSPAQVYSIEADFGLVICLLYGLDLLENYGMLFVLNFLNEQLVNSSNKSISRRQMRTLPEFAEMIGMLEEYVKQNVKHPKIVAMEDIVLKHFKSSSSSRVIIFTG